MRGFFFIFVGMNENLDPTDENFSAEEHDIEKVLKIEANYLFI